MKSNNKKLSKTYVFFLLFLLFFLFIPFSQLGHLNLIPGDLGDARLNNYFLENIYLFFNFKSDSLWSLGFFYPFPFTGGFSDNLFGSSLVYIFFRALNIKSDTAFQLWFFAGYLFNYAASYCSFRKLGGSFLAACLGALIFSFALPTTAHAIHAQLHYRFGLPLALTFLVFFLKDKKPRNFLIFLSWLVWQFYCGIYMGFFTLLMSLILFISFIFIQYSKPNYSFSSLMQTLKQMFLKFSVTYFFLTIILILMLFLLFYPYIQVSHLYGVKRDWSEISLMLPRLQSYFLFESSKIWKFFNFSPQLPMRHEHQMFFGFIPISLALYGFFTYSRQQKKSQEFFLIATLIPILFLLTLSVGGFSLWYFLHKLPLFSAIRAITRVDQAMLFPLGYLAMLAINKIETKSNGPKIIWIAIIPFMLSEFSFVSMGTSIKSDWRSRISNLEKILPREIPKDKVLFFASRGESFYADEIDAMWISLNRNSKTINGYSGIYPPNYSIEYRTECSELPKRVLAYLKFNGTENHLGLYKELIQKVIPIGFVGCDPNYLDLPPKISVSYKEYGAGDFQKVFLNFKGRHKDNEKYFLKIEIVNLGDSPIYAQSGIGKPVRVAWRYLEKSKPVSDWSRLNLPFDIDVKNKIFLNIPVDLSYQINADQLEITIVQELVFWAHDVGMKSLKIDIN